MKFNTFVFVRPLYWLGLALALSAAMLSGCAAPMVSARVTSFQQWPADAAGQRYRFAPEAGQGDDLEYQAYQDMVRAAIGATGLVEAQGGEPARFVVGFQYGTKPTQMMQRRTYDPYFAGGYFGSPWWGGPWGPGWYGPAWVDVPVQAVRNNLRLEIRDAARNNAEVYRATAYIVSENENLVKAMPYLVRAIFDDFPGNNGTERRVQYPVDP